MGSWQYLIFDRKTRSSPAVESGFEVRDVGKPHFLKHVRRKGRPSTACSIEDDPLFRIDLAAVVF